MERRFEGSVDDDDDDDDVDEINCCWLLCKGEKELRGGLAKLEVLGGGLEL